MTIKSFLHKLSSYDGDFYLKKALADAQVTGTVAPAAGALTPVAEAVTPATGAVAPATGALMPVAEAVTPATGAVAQRTQATTPQGKVEQIYIIPKAVEEINKQIVIENRAIQKAKFELNQKASAWFSGGDSKRALEMLNAEVYKIYTPGITAWNQKNPQEFTKKYFLSTEIYKNLLQVIGRIGKLHDQTSDGTDSKKILLNLSTISNKVYQAILDIFNQTKDDGQEAISPGGLPALPAATTGSTTGAPAIGTQGVQGGSQGSLGGSQGAQAIPDSFKLTEAERYWKGQLDKAGSKEAVQKLLDARIRYIDSMAVSKRESYGTGRDKLTQDERPKYKQRAQQIAAPYFAKFSK